MGGTSGFATLIRIISTFFSLIQQELYRMYQKRLPRKQACKVPRRPKVRNRRECCGWDERAQFLEPVTQHTATGNVLQSSLPNKKDYFEIKKVFKNIFSPHMSRSRWIGCSCPRENIVLQTRMIFYWTIFQSNHKKPLFMNYPFNVVWPVVVSTLIFSRCLSPRPSM